jgi:RNA polymerase sigma factor (sigma-70 family)
MRSQKKTWLLTHEALHGLLAQFDDDPERAAGEYELIRSELVRLFRYRGCRSPQDLADVTIDRVARKLAEGASVPRTELSNYFYGVARNVLREYLRNPEAVAPPVDESTPDQAENPEESSRLQDARETADARLRCLEKCLEELPPETRKLVVSYYEGTESAKIKNRQRLAGELEVSINSLRIRVHRIRERLEKCVSGCMNYE